MKKLMGFLFSAVLAAGCMCSVSAEEETIEELKNGSVISCSFQDYDGNTVKAEELFGENRLTFVNFWASFCGPCINEMPELQELSELYEGDVAFVGVLMDARDAYDETDEGILGDAEAILEWGGVEYTNVTSSFRFLSLSKIMAFPTSVVVDQNGTILTEPVIGSNIEAYKSMIEDGLARTEESQESGS